MEQLLETLSRGLLAIRIEPGRRPALLPDLPEPDALQKRINGFVTVPCKYFETEFKNIEQKHGRFSRSMVVAHRYMAELYWRSGQLKEEQNSWIRAARALEKLEPRDADEIAFCNERLGISRAIAGDNVGAEEAFAEALKILREAYGETHPRIGRLERKVARVFADLGAVDLGWRHHEQALEALMKAFPTPTAEFAELHEEQGEFLIDYRQYAKGIAILERGIEVWQKIEYPTSPRIALARRTLANAQMLAGNMAGAEQNARSQRELISRESGVSSVHARDADLALAEILLTLSDQAKAAEVTKLMEPHFVLTLDKSIPDDVETALPRCFYACALTQTNRAADAVEHFERSLRIVLKTQSRPSFVVAECLRDYGQSLLETNRKVDGLKALDDAEAELSALSRLRPRYLRIATSQIDDIRARIQKARQ
jgi:tetratricopeptide (TPR) repeat protein